MEQHFSVALKMQTCSVHACLRTYILHCINLMLKGPGALHTGRDAL